MSFLDSIRAGRQLRKVGIKNDASAPSLVDAVKLTDEYDALVLQANIENWGTTLAAYTPRTIQVPLTLAQGSLLLRAYEKLEHSDEVATAAAEYVASGQISGALVSEEARLLEELGASIQTAIDDLTYQNGEVGCFMKLSSRSPKDAAVRSGVFEAYYARAVRDDEGKLRELDNEQKLWLLCEAEGAALRFKDAASVIRALVLSERVWQDMTLAMRHADKWRQNVILRRWEPVPIDMEFRTFVANGRITAISQYAYQLYSPRLNIAAHLELATDAIRGLFTDLWPILSKQGFTKCVLDFGVIPARGWWILARYPHRVNPFEETTDGALFSWTRERDVIEGKAEGVDYPEVRITETSERELLLWYPGLETGHGQS
ncbi:hypothetical protein K438DRAFT_946273 [Mycena galopus ATCC 62051]|nr:hypothetical protein K438DRAFT_946273 [Mycena galopus ATCC 62051]